MTLAPDAWNRSVTEPTEFYLECLRSFQIELPVALQRHRTYFSEPGKARGFGEHAFHTMWDLLLREFKPPSFLEIGVFRGQTISLVTLWSRLNKAPCEVWGISPFSGAEDSVSKFPQGLDYLKDTLLNFDHFGLPHPRLVRAFSTDPEALQTIQSRRWDMIYIDGNHDEDIVRKDWDNCSASIKPGGIIVLDDSGLGTTYRAPCFAFAGWPGPSRIAQEIDRSAFRELMQVGHNRVFQKLP